MEHLLLKIGDNIKKIGIPLHKKRVLVAISGGPDSVWLAYSLRVLGGQIGLAHVNYHLRGEDSERDEALVRAYAQRWEVPLYVRAWHKEEGELSQNSFQVQAREARYQFFESVMDQEGYDYCATAHHADDEVETLLMSFLKSRNTSLLQGIPTQRDRYVRPLWNVWKHEIIAVLEAQDLPFRWDLSNEKPDYLRNRIRGELIPLMEALNPSFKSHLIRRAAWYAQQEKGLRVLLAPWFPPRLEEEKSIQWDWKAFVDRHGRAYLPVLVQYGLERWNITGVQAEEVSKLIESQSGKWVGVDNGKVIRTRTGLAWEPTSREDTVELKVPAFQGNRTIHYGAVTIHLEFPFEAEIQFGNPSVFYLDARKFSFPLTLRNWKNGDKMIPLGMRNFKKLSDIFIDEKFDPRTKNDAVVVESGDRIIALIGFRISEEVKLDTDTEEVLKIHFELRAG